MTIEIDETNKQVVWNLNANASPPRMPSGSLICPSTSYWPGDGGPRISLATLMNRHGTDKLFFHHYEGEYQRHFEPIRDRTLSILEIGVGGFAHADRGGESLRVWRDYFPNARVLGIDIHEKQLAHLGERITIRVCDQNDPVQLTELNEQHGPFDIVIDDGSHHQEHVLTSYVTLWPMLAPGGIYVIEDMATAYWPEYGGNPEQPPTIGLIATLINNIHQRYWRALRPGEGDPAEVKSVHVSREICFIYKT